MEIILMAMASVVAYLVGSFPTGYLLVKMRTGKDLRKIGSGSTGATNVRRELGDSAARQVLAVDFLKGMLPVLVAIWIVFPKAVMAHVFVAVLLVVGHSKSIFLGFKGGKSAATSLGTIAALNPIAAVAVGLTAFLVTHYTRYVSAGSIAAAVVAPVAMVLLGNPTPYWVYSLITCLYVIFLHRENIGRLMSGTENKLE